MTLPVSTIQADIVQAAVADDATVRLRRGSGLWDVRPSWRDRLMDRLAPDWFALEQDDRAELVKAGRARTTWRVRLGDQTVYAKVQDAHGFLDHVKYVIGIDAARREWRAASRSTVAGVPVVPLLAVGRCSGGKPRTALLSVGFADAVSLSAAWDTHTAGGGAPGQRRDSVRKLIDAVARLFATAHEHGFIHSDAHPGNIIVRGVPQSGLDVRFVDVAGARQSRRPLAMEKAVRSLAQIRQYFRRRTTRAERLRFLRVYLAHRRSTDRPNGDRSNRRGWTHAILREAGRHSERLASRRDRRLRHNAKYFSTLSVGGAWRATVVLRLHRRDLFADSAVPDRTVAQWRSILAPLLGSADGAANVGGDCVDSGLQFELSRPESLLARLRSTVSGSRAREAFERCHKLRHRDVPTELLLGFAEHRTRGLIDATLLIRPAPPRPRGPDRKDRNGTSERSD